MIGSCSAISARRTISAQVAMAASMCPARVWSDGAPSSAGRATGVPRSAGTPSRSPSPIRGRSGRTAAPRPRGPSPGRARCVRPTRPAPRTRRRPARSGPLRRQADGRRAYHGSGPAPGGRKPRGKGGCVLRVGNGGRRSSASVERSPAARTCASSVSRREPATELNHSTPLRDQDREEQEEEEERRPHRFCFGLPCVSSWRPPSSSSRASRASR